MRCNRCTLEQPTRDHSKLCRRNMLVCRSLNNSSKPRRSCEQTSRALCGPRGSHAFECRPIQNLICQAEKEADSASCKQTSPALVWSVRKPCHRKESRVTDSAPSRSIARVGHTRVWVCAAVSIGATCQAQQVAAEVVVGEAGAVIPVRRERSRDIRPCQHLTNLLHRKRPQGGPENVQELRPRCSRFLRIGT